jgi:hypothetical protein
MYVGLMMLRRMDTAEQLVSAAVSVEVKIAVEELKEYKSRY